jgi:hypothetical protein
MPIWHRHSDPLIELSLTASDAPVNERRWELRLEGNVLELKLMNDAGVLVEKLYIEREGTHFKKISYDDREFPL